MIEGTKDILGVGTHIVIDALGNHVYRVDERTPAYVSLSYVEPNEGRRIREPRRRKIDALAWRLATREEIVEQDQHVILMRYRVNQARREAQRMQNELQRLTAELPKQLEYAADLAAQLDNLRQVATRKLGDITDDAPTIVSAVEANAEEIRRLT